MSRKLKLEWEVELPDQFFEEGLNEDEFKVRLIAKAKEELVLELFQQKRISSGKGAALLGITRRDFWELLHKHGIPYFDYPPEEWEKELEAVEDFKENLGYRGKSENCL